MARLYDAAVGCMYLGCDDELLFLAAAPAGWSVFGVIVRERRLQPCAGKSELSACLPFGEALLVLLRIMGGLIGGV